MLWLALLLLLVLLIPLPQRKRPRPFNTTGHCGSKSELRFEGGKVVDAAGNEVRPIPLQELLKTRSK